jgi:two-component system LytT family response regulator
MYNILIVDDEPLARSGLSKIVASRRDVARIETAADGVRALEVLQPGDIDVLFLDIQMPELSGFDVLERIQQHNLSMPAVVFVTAHNEHATKAFDHNAVDYVLKPFSAARVQKALDTAIRRSYSERAAKIVDAYPYLQSANRSRPTRIAIKVQGRILFIDPAAVLYVQAEGNYVLLQAEGGSHLLREPLGQVEQKLIPFGFVRIHRSVIVNSAYVKEVHPWPTGDYILKLANGKEFTVTRSYKKNLAQLTAGGIGVDSWAAENQVGDRS